jgi:putative oxidoreductase
MLQRLDALSARWLARSGIRLRPSIAVLRVSLGLVFLGFGVLKFVPGLSPAEDLVEQTVHKLSLGLVPGSVGATLVAALESAIGVLLITGRFLRLGLLLLGLAMVGILSPVVLLPDRLFAGPANAPTLEGQYVLKDVVLLAAGFVVAAWTRSGNTAGIRGGRGESIERDPPVSPGGSPAPGWRSDEITGVDDS